MTSFTLPVWRAPRPPYPIAVWAQGYPNKAIRIVVPFAAGGPTDVVARLIGAKVGESLGQQVIIENVLGASGNIGTRNVARAAPDGYTLLVTASGFVVNPSLYANSPYDAIKDFAPITVAASAPNVLITHPSLEVKTVKELVELIRANPGKHNFASAGVGQTGHLAGELMKTSYKLDLTHVPFNGGAPIMNSMMGGHTLIAFLSLPSAAAFIRDNRVRGLAVTSPKRSSVVPDVPTMAEAGFPELETEFFQGVLAPAGTPKEIIDRWHARNRQSRAAARRAKEARRHELRGATEHAGSVRGHDQGRGGEVGRGDPRRQDPASAVTRGGRCAVRRL